MKTGENSKDSALLASFSVAWLIKTEGQIALRVLTEHPGGASWFFASRLPASKWRVSAWAMASRESDWLNHGRAE